MLSQKIIEISDNKRKAVMGIIRTGTVFSIRKYCDKGVTTSKRINGKDLKIKDLRTMVTFNHG